MGGKYRCHVRFVSAWDRGGEKPQSSYFVCTYTGTTRRGGGNTKHLACAVHVRPLCSLGVEPVEDSHARPQLLYRCMSSLARVQP